MKTPRLAAALLIALAPCTLIPPAFAQATADDPMTAMARARFKEGVEFYDKGQYEQARASFLQAYALKKHPAVLLNLAWSCLKSGHVIEGKKYFEQFLAESKDATDKQKADASDGLTQARAKLGRIEVQAAAGTDVTVDGDRVGTAPLADAIVVEAGAHTVKFKGPDGTTDTQSVSVLGGQRAVAKFGAPPSAATAAPTPAPKEAGSPAAPPAAETSSRGAPAEEATRPAEAKHQNIPVVESSPGPFAKPANPVPAYILGGVGLVGIGTGIVMYFQKQSAQSNADNVASQIIANGGSSASCSPPSGKFVAACSAYNSDLNDVNMDATVANIAAGVGLAALAGAVIYWVVAPKEDSGSAALHPLPVLTPAIGHSSGGLSLSGQF